MTDEANLLRTLAASASRDLHGDNSRLDQASSSLPPKGEDDTRGTVMRGRHEAWVAARLGRGLRRSRSLVEAELERAERMLDQREHNLKHAGFEVRSRAEANLARVEERVAALRAELGLDRAWTPSDEDSFQISEDLCCNRCGEPVFADGNQKWQRGGTCSACEPPAWAASLPTTRKGKNRR